MIEIDDAAEKQSDAGQESIVDVTAGDKISQREALEAVLIASANNVARLVARWDAGSEEAFVEKMNKAAKDLGMTNTTYTDPSGLNNTTVSTAVDQVKLARAAMEQPAFREIAAMMSYDDYKGVNRSQLERTGRAQQRRRHQDRHHHLGTGQPRLRREEGRRRRDPHHRRRRGAPARGRRRQHDPGRRALPRATG
ncbi:hypothetical protein SHIRM173S_06071 [Streptomyces hirsutus]